MSRLWNAKKTLFSFRYTKIIQLSWEISAGAHVWTHGWILIPEEIMPRISQCNSVPLILTHQPLIMAVNTREAVCWALLSNLLGFSCAWSIQKSWNEYLDLNSNLFDLELKSWIQIHNFGLRIPTSLHASDFNSVLNVFTRIFDF